MNTVKCPKCGEDIEISQAIRVEIEETLTKDIEASIRDQADLEVNLAKKELAESLSLIRDLKNKDKDREIDFQKKLMAEENKIREEERARLMEEKRLKEMEKDKVINDLRKSLQEAQRRAEQGSQQTQGEVLELDLEDSLSKAFPTDEIHEVKKGELGADIRQVVKTARGSFCGVILWESKSTKQWVDGWTEKLRKDMLKDKANAPVIVTETLPKGLEHGMGIKNGVWVVKPSLAVSLAVLLRDGLINVAKEKFVAGNVKSNAESVYTYVTGHEFVNQVKEMLMTYQAMREQIDRERRAFEKIWKEREIHVEKLIKGTVNVYGVINATSGSALPKLDVLELESSK